MTLEITLKEKDSVINRNITRALIKQLNSKVQLVGIRISKIIQRRFAKLLMEDKTVNSLINGELRGQFGLVDPQLRIKAVLDQWLMSMQVKPKPLRLTKNGIVGGFKLQMVESNWEDVLGLDIAIFKTPEHGFNLEWLSWLLIKGGKTVVMDYDFIAKNGRGRTDRGLMAKVRRRRWNVPAAYQGNRTNNFATQTIDILHSELDDIFEKELERVFN